MALRLDKIPNITKALAYERAGMLTKNTKTTLIGSTIEGYKIEVITITFLNMNAKVMFVDTFVSETR